MESRIALTMVIALVGLVDTASAAAPRCGPEWMTAPPVRGSRVVCEDGDPSCDFGSEPHSCTFRLAMCFNADRPDQPACSPPAVADARLIAGRARTVADAANQDAIYDALAGLGAFIHGTCVGSGAPCTTHGDCNAPASTDGRCERTAAFDPPLRATNQCTGATSVTVPLKSASGRYVKGARRFKLRLDDGRSFRTLKLVCKPAPPLPRGVYDVTAGRDAEPEAYVPTVDQLTVADFTVGALRGGPLMVGHPVEMRATIDVHAEPFRATVWYGLQDGDGNRCVIDHVELDHLGAMYDAAAKANLAIASHDDGIDPPSLADCSANRRCPAGEECLAFRRRVATEEPVYDPQNSDPMHVPEEVVDPGLPSHDVGTTIVTSHLCATREYAAAEVVRAHASAPVLTPADLAGSVRQRHVLGATDALPAACTALVGATDVAAWLTFDPEEATDFVQRPVFEAPEVDPDASLDEDTQRAAQERAAYLQRLPVSAAVAGVHADDGLDVHFRRLAVGSSVVLIDRADHPRGDLHVGAEFSVDGTPTPAEQELLPDASLIFHFTLAPAGAPRAGCEPDGPSLDALPLHVVSAHPDTPDEDISDETVTDLRLGAAHDTSFPLYLPPALRTKLYGEWACWDQFEVRGCFTTDLPQSSQFGTSDDCATTGILVLRDEAPEGGAVVEPPPSHLQAASLLQRIGNPGCSDTLLQQYADNMTKYYELSNTVQVTDYYTYDILRWVWGSLTPPGTGNGFTYINSAVRQEYYFNHIKSYLQECEALGGNACWTTWGFTHSPWNIDIRDYQNNLIPYFWNAWGRSGPENYLKFKNNPQQFTRDFFNYECAGIASGTVCSAIGYQEHRIPELATNIRNVLVNRQVSSPLAALISPHGVHRCLGRGYPALQRVAVDPRGVPTTIPDDDVFYAEYLKKVCEKGKYKAEADRIWNEIVSSCTEVAKPFADSGLGVTAGRFIPSLYRSYDTGYKLGLKGVVEGGIVNDYLVSVPAQQFKLIFGAQGRAYLESDPTNDVVGGWLDVYDIFKVWMLANIYSDVLSSNVDAGFHVLTNDVWKISFKIPTGEYELPEPPELAKEKEKCKYLWKPPMPFRIELCGSIGGKVELGVAAKLSKTGLDGANPDKSDWPGMAGVITPGAAITNSGRAGVDVLVASAGIALLLDPTLGVYIPVEVGAKWNLVMPTPKLLNWAFAPYVKVALELKALGGELNGYTRWKIGGSGETLYPIVEWDPLDLADWTLVKHDWEVSGSKGF